MPRNVAEMLLPLFSASPGIWRPPAARTAAPAPPGRGLAVQRDRDAGGGFVASGVSCGVGAFVEAGQVAVGQGADPELLADPGGDRGVELVGVQALDQAADRRLAGCDVALFGRVPAGAEPFEGFLGQRGGVLADRGEAETV